MHHTDTKRIHDVVLNVAEKTDRKRLSNEQNVTVFADFKLENKF